MKISRVGSQVRKLGFTGSTQIGHTIMSSCAKSNLKKVSLELGGKSPLIIFSDFDLDKAVRIALGSVFFNKVGDKARLSLKTRSCAT